MSNFFKEAVEFTLKNEGILANDKNDKGGLTIYGISSKFFFKAFPDATLENFKDLTVDDAIAIYEKYFWNAHSLHRINSPVTVIIFDQVVNRGFGGIISAQKAMNALGYTLSPDGIMGPRSVDVLAEILAKSNGHYSYVTRYVLECQKAYIAICKRDPSQNDFIKGWFNRTHKYLEGDFHVYRAPRY